jgi:hypothetical protein
MVTICDTDGKIMHSDHRPGVTNLLTPDESRKSLEMAVNAWKRSNALQCLWGTSILYTWLQNHKRIMRILFRELPASLLTLRIPCKLTVTFMLLNYSSDWVSLFPEGFFSRNPLGLVIESINAHRAHSLYQFCKNIDRITYLRRRRTMRLYALDH